VELSSAIGARPYLDTNVLIYFVEGHPTYSTMLETLFDRIDESEIEGVTSELSLAEVLVKPIADGRTDVADIYRKLLSQESPTKMKPVDRPTLLLSAETRARCGGRAFDAIHVATALSCGCTSLITNDDRIRAPGGLPILALRELVVGHAS
jgi:predicted nucleic acid-binding protein